MKKEPQRLVIILRKNESISIIKPPDFLIDMDMYIIVQILYYLSRRLEALAERLRAAESECSVFGELAACLGVLGVSS